MTSRTHPAHESGIMCIGALKCAARFVWYWFRFPTGWPVSGHEYVEQADGRLVCLDCGRVSE